MVAGVYGRNGHRVQRPAVTEHTHENDHVQTRNRSEMGNSVLGLTTKHSRVL